MHTWHITACMQGTHVDQSTHADQSMHGVEVMHEWEEIGSGEFVPKTWHILNRLRFSPPHGPTMSR